MKFSQIRLIATSMVLAACGVSAVPASAAFWEKKGNGQIESRSFDVGTFESIAVDGSFDLDIRPGQPSVAVALDSNLFEDLGVKVDRTVLTIKTGWRAKASSRPRVAISLPNLLAVKTTGNVNTSISVAAQAKNLALDLTGSGHAAIKDAALDSLKINSFGSINLTAQGKVGALDLDAGGQFGGHFENLAIDTATVDAGGDCTLRFGALKSISGKVSGSSSVTYDQTPEHSNLKSN